MQDTHLKRMFYVLASLLLLICFLFFYPEAFRATAAQHPVHPSLLISTGSYSDLASWLGVLFGLLLISLIGLSYVIGLYRKKSTGKLSKRISIGVTIFSVIWILVKMADGIYLNDPEPLFIGGFPIPTALLVYGLGVFPVTMIPIYYYYFDEEIFDEEDQKEFEALLKQTHDRVGGEG